MMSKKMRLRRLVLSIVMLAAILIGLRLIQPEGAHAGHHKAHGEAALAEEVKAVDEAAVSKCDTCPNCGYVIKH